jgi:hypothetical protein
MTIPPPDSPSGSVRWQTLTEKLLVRDRWGAFCRRVVAATAPPPAGPTSLLREFLVGHPEHIPGGRPLAAVRPGEEDALAPAGVRAFLAWAVREKGADPALARGVADQLPDPPIPL